MFKTNKPLDYARGKKVLVGLSGGVDSSVSCVLLKEQGYHVEAVFVKVWQPDFIECNWRDEMRDAMRICAQLGVPFHFLDLEKEYKKEVADYMIEGYKKGITPNPDIMCNKYIKFGHLFNFAKEKGFDFVATGHYAQTKEGKLFRGKDTNKDQSYFLWTLTKDKLEQILFPIGNLEKEEVRKIAERNDLFNYVKKDSQGICILGPIDIKDFLKKYVDVKKGDVLNEKEEKIGTHDGAILYTIGERHGFKIDKKHKGTDDGTLYVIAKDMKKNTITVSEKSEDRKMKSIKISDVSFVNKESSLSSRTLRSFTDPGDAGSSSYKIFFQTRYRQKPQQGILISQKGKACPVMVKPFYGGRREKYILKADFDEIPAIGQSVVFYKEDECIGGGIIEELN